MPADGKAAACYYRKGKFVNAALDKASVDNERMAVVLELTGEHPHAGTKMGVVQIAGLVARRILCNAQEGDRITRRGRALRHYPLRQQTRRCLSPAGRDAAGQRWASI